MFKIRNSPKLNKPGQAYLGLEHWDFGDSNFGFFHCLHGSSVCPSSDGIGVQAGKAELPWV